MKKVISFLFVILTLMSCTCFAFAAENPGNEIQPYWNVISSATIGLDFSNDGSTGYVSTTVDGPSNTSRIETELVVYKKNLLTWSEVKDFGTKVSTGYTDQVRSGTFAAESGKTYKAVLKIKMTAGSTTETEELEYKAKNS